MYALSRHLATGVLLLALACPVFAKKSAAPVAPPPAPVVKPVSQGTFQDASGQTHHWSITQTHMLQWDGTPYLPVGGTFTPHSWVEGQTDAAWTADTAALQILKQHGVTDLTLNAGTLGLTHVPPDAVQRLLTYLDSNGFHYALEIADFPKEPLTGYTVEPEVFRNPSPPEPGTARFTHISGLEDAFSVLVSSTGERLATSKATVTPDGTAQVNITVNGDADTPAGTGDVLLLYPRRRFDPGTPESHLPDLWQGYDEYRDRLITYFSHIKLGPGFRFFLDPLTARIGLFGEVQNLIPTSDGFHLDFEAWLDQKYGQNLDRLNRQWGVANMDLPGFDVAARCVPLWYQFKGLPDLYDPVTGTYYDVTNLPHIQSEYWNDLQEFKIESTRSYMDSIADALKHGVADVPVIYTWTEHSPLFTDDETTGGYDGLGVEAYGHDMQLIGDATAFAYAQAQETPKTMWLIASATADEPPDQKVTPGFLSRAVLFNDWNALQGIGVRGFYAQALQRLPADANQNVSLVGLPDQLDWLSAYAADLQAAAPDLDSEQPRVLWYPQDVAGAQVGVRLLPDDVWWLPTFQTGTPLTLGVFLQGYALVDPDDAQAMNVLWSTASTVTTAKFDFDKKTTPLVTTPGGTPVQVAHKGTTWTIPVSATPTVVRGIKELPLTSDAADTAQAEAERLLALAQKQNVGTGTLSQDLFRVENDTINSSQESNAQTTARRYTQLQQVISLVTALLQPYAWVEGESSANNSFTAVSPDPNASGGAYLTLNTDTAPPDDDPDDGYRAVYQFRVNAPGDYTFWMGGSAPGAESSPFTWQVDGGAASPGAGMPSSGPPYAGKFAWRDLGDLTLDRGKHTLTIQVTGRRSLDHHYALSLDAFCITRIPFLPDGTFQPSVSSWLPPPPPPDKGKHGKH